MSRKSKSPKPPELECPELAAFAVADLASVRRVFRSAPAMESQQGWRGRRERDFAPMRVRAGWRRRKLFVFAELDDADILTAATGHHQRFWELGDVLEIFLRPENQSAYVELHVAPNNFRLQVCYPDAAAVVRARQTGEFGRFIVREPLFRSRVWLRPKAGKWFVLAEIPTRTVAGGAAELAGAAWRFSFSRYDYTRRRSEPVISSTSPHAKADFHRQQEWGTLRFVSTPAK